MAARTLEELVQIGKDLAADKIFTNLHLGEDVMLDQCFMALTFLNEEQRKELEENKVVVIFEYLNKAAPRTINGYPMFFSMQTLTEEEAKTVWEMYNKIKDFEDEITRRSF